MIGLLVWLLILLCVVAIIWYVIKTLPLPEPVRLVVIVVVALVCIIILLQVGASLAPADFRLRLGN